MRTSCKSLRVSALASRYSPYRVAPSSTSLQGAICVSPTPLLVVVALGDHLTVADEALAAYERALQPKKLATLKGGHFDAYVADFAAASGAARDWFVEHLR